MLELANQLYMMEREVKRLRAVLEDIADPLKKLEADCKAKGDDYELDGTMTMLLINDPNWLREKAKKALSQT